MLRELLVNGPSTLETLHGVYNLVTLITGLVYDKAFATCMTKFTILTIFKCIDQY